MCVCSEGKRVYRAEGIGRGEGSLVDKDKNEVMGYGEEERGCNLHYTEKHACSGGE